MMPPQAVSRVEQLQSDLMGEFRKWRELGALLDQCAPNGASGYWMTLFQVEAITRVLRDDPEVAERLDIAFLEVQIERLGVMRETFEETKREQEEAKHPSAVLAARKVLLGPDGQPLV